MFKKFLIVALLALLPGIAFAQSAAKQPNFVANNAWVDVGNGPVDVLSVQGNGNVYTRGSSAVASTSGSSTTLTLTATPTYAPCVGCVISGTGITAGTTVAAFNGTTTVTLSAAMTVAASTTVYYGVACPTSGAPPVNASMSPPVAMTSGMSRAIPLYTYARVCAYGAGQAGYSLVTLPIGSY